jgi:predicted outer membrane repeat protein
MLFSGNSSTGDGGGLYAESGNTALSSVTFDANTAGGSGGGFASRSGEPVVKNSRFTNNTANASEQVDIYTTGGGGGLSASSTIEIVGSSFSGNTATNGSGGGVLVNGKINISNSSLKGNQAKGCGGGLALSLLFFQLTSDLTMSSSSVTGNSSRDGAGLCMGLRSANVTNSTVSGNRASNAGGGIWSERTEISVTHATFFDNTALIEGGGDIYAFNSTSVVVRASVFASTGQSCKLGFGAAVTTTGGNVGADSTCGLTGTNDLQNTNPLLGELTPVSNQVVSVRIPAKTSPTVDRVPANLCLNVDARGVARPQGSACDSGAVERTTTDP